MRERTHARTVDESIVDAQRLRARRETRQEAFVQRLLDVEARRRDADLAGVAKLRRDREVEHMVEVDIVEHDHRGVTTELHGRALGALGRELEQLLADRHRAGERDLADHRRCDQVRRHGGRIAEHDRDDTRRHTRLDQRGRDRQRGRRRLLGRLQDAGAPGPERGPELAGRIAEREVPWRKRRDRADRFAHDGHAYARSLLRQHATVGPPPLLRVPLEDVRGHADLDTTLGQRLALLERREPGNLLRARAQQIRGAPQDPAALHGRERAPGRPCTLRGIERAVQVGRRRER